MIREDERQVFHVLKVHVCFQHSESTENRQAFQDCILNHFVRPFDERMTKIVSLLHGREHQELRRTLEGNPRVVLSAFASTEENIVPVLRMVNLNRRPSSTRL